MICWRKDAPELKVENNVPYVTTWLFTPDWPRVGVTTAFQTYEEHQEVVDQVAARLALGQLGDLLKEKESGQHKGLGITLQYPKQFDEYHDGRGGVRLVPHGDPPPEVK